MCVCVYAARVRWVIIILYVHIVMYKDVCVCVRRQGTLGHHHLICTYSNVQGCVICCQCMCIVYVYCVSVSVCVLCMCMWMYNGETYPEGTFLNIGS